MDGLRQALDKLRTEAEKGASRRKEADARSKRLLATVKERDNELESLRERLDLTRRIFALIRKLDETRHAIRVNKDNLALASEKVDQLSHKLSRVEKEGDTLEEQYYKIESQSKTLDAAIEGLI